MAIARCRASLDYFNAKALRRRVRKGREEEIEFPSFIILPYIILHSLCGLCAFATLR
jgi:hypothetical protein